MYSFSCPTLNVHNIFFHQKCLLPNSLFFAQELIKKGANVSQCNKLEETPIDRAKVKFQNMFKGTISVKLSLKNL